MKQTASKAPARKARNIKVDYLARVEGEGSLYIKMHGQHVADVRLKIFEPPRFFEAFLRGRSYTEVPDIVARICGICPIAYQMSAVHAIEQAFGVTIDPMVRLLRRLFYCGEWIESHALHVYMLHAPDFLGYADGIAMAGDYPEQVRKGLELKKIGNELVGLLGGREIHPISACVGGFFRVPSTNELQAFEPRLRRALELAIETVRWVAGFSFPDFEQDYEFVSVSHPDEYPFNEGRLISSRGLDIPIGEFNDHFVERHVAYSNALQSVLRQRGSYHVGPLARFNLNFSKLPPSVQQLAREAGVEPPCRNPFRSIIVRALELVFACEEGLRIIASYEPPERPAAASAPRAGVGHGCTEAPRGFLYHRYELDEQGAVVAAQIVPPTAQNQKRIEDDLREFVAQIHDLPDEQMTWQCEQMVRNYDPCISCATHFLKLTVERE
jgi:coenzyme F420-reducing hydrogenase alpha subunit